MNYPTPNELSETIINELANEKMDKAVRASIERNQGCGTLNEVLRRVKMETGYTVTEITLSIMRQVEPRGNYANNHH